MRTSLLIAAVVCGLLAQQATAQSSRRQRAAASRALHKAWLKEKLDLDTRAAAGGYDATMKSSSKNMPERWVALARLEELGRLGVLTPEPKSRPRQVPREVKRALTRLEAPIPYKDVLANPDAEIKLKKLRPATPLVQTWAGSQVSEFERMNQDRRRRQGQGVTPEQLRRWHAWDVLRRELEGNRNQAAQLRRLQFPNWKAPKVSGKHEDVLAKAYERLTAWIAEEDRSTRRTTLRDFQKGLKEEAKISAANAVKFLRRLPHFGERLLTGKSNND